MTGRLFKRAAAPLLPKLMHCHYRDRLDILPLIICRLFKRGAAPLLQL